MMSAPGACYRDNGYRVEEDVLQSADVEELRTEIIALLRGERGDIAAMVKAILLADGCIYSNKFITNSIKSVLMSM